MSWTFTDFFCGFGGSSIGMTEAGGELIWAANHWDLAIETHAANFRNADHFQGDISGYDMRRVPKADVAWISPECTWHSPAGGRKRVRADLDLFDDYVPDAAGERSRATMWDVVRAAEAKQFKIVIVENVVEVTSWPLFETWLAGMGALGYEHQILCVSAAHIGGELNPHAPQWRDRIYFIFYKKGIPFPNVQPRPLAWCTQCEKVVEGVQSWKKSDGRRIGKYGPQYVYVCSAGNHATHRVEPYVLPAATAIDWTDLGERIGDRPLREFKDKKTGTVTMGHLAPATMRRVGVGIRMFARPIVAAAAGQTWDASSSGHPGGTYNRVAPADSAPLVSRTGTGSDAVAVPPFMAGVNHGEDDDGRLYDPSERPLPARSTKIGDAVVSPFMVERRDYDGPDAGRVHGTDEPMSTRTASDRGIHGLIVPAGGSWNDTAYPTDEPLRTRMTRDTEGIAIPPMVTPVGGTWSVEPESVHEPFRTRTTAEDNGLITPPFVVYNYDTEGGDERRIKSTDSDPLATVVNGRHEQLVAPPFITELHGTSTVRGVDDALAAVTAGGNHHGVTVPEDAFIQKHHGGVDYARIEHMVKSIHEPLPSLVARVNTSLVIPYRRGARAYGANARPLHTLSTHDSGALVEPDFTEDELQDMILNSRFRMLGPREHLRAQRFPDTYQVKGNQSEQTKGAGNAVASNVANYIGQLTSQALGTPLERVA